MKRFAMALVTPHENAIDKALVNALHAFSNTTGISKDDHPWDTERSYRDLSASSMGILLIPTQTFGAAGLNVSTPQTSNIIADGSMVCAQCESVEAQISIAQIGEMKDVVTLFPDRHCKPYNGVGCRCSQLEYS